MTVIFTGDVLSDYTHAERDIQARCGDKIIDFAATGVLSNVYRVASLLKNQMEREVLAEHNLSFTAFIILFVLWVWGNTESNLLAERAGISKGTLTGVVKTLEKRLLCERVPHPTDRRKVTVTITPAGIATTETIFPRYNKMETELVAAISFEAQLGVAHFLRKILRANSNLGIYESDDDQAAATINNNGSSVNKTVEENA